MEKTYVIVFTESLPPLKELQVKGDSFSITIEDFQIKKDGALIFAAPRQQIRYVREEVAREGEDRVSGPTPGNNFTAMEAGQAKEVNKDVTENAPRFASLHEMQKSYFALRAVPAGHVNAVSSFVGYLESRLKGMVI